ncbi:MAG: hypothetical protein VX498_07170 [Myxococcota bacterium]|nr:hypothetical protein [Myxococcota bacterium]
MTGREKARSYLAVLAVGMALAIGPGCGDVASHRPPEREGDDPGECLDGADNDANGLYDCDDPACSGAPECQENQPPAGHSVRIDPPGPKTSDNLLCVVETAALDPDGDPIEYSYSWTVDEEPVATESATIDAIETTRGQDWVCIVTPNDEFNPGPPATAMTVIENTPPTPPGVDITPGAPRVWDDMICAVTEPSEDIDGDEVTYSYDWVVDGNSAGTSDSTVSWTATQSDQEWMCIVTPFDGIDDGPTGEASSIVGFELTPHTTTGRLHSCGIAPDGTPSCWGIDDQSSLDFGQVTGMEPNIFIELSAGRYHSCGMDFQTGTVVCWGDNSLGQILSPSDSFMRIEAGWDHTCGVRYDGDILCWGSTTWWTEQPPTAPALDITAGDEFACARMADDSIECWWGDNTNPTFATPEGQWLQLDAGEKHLCAISALGSLECWGDDSYGQVSGHPTSVAFSQVSAGRRHTCGVEEGTGYVHCWGNVNQNDIPPGSFIGVSAGWWQTCGGRENGTFECWGCESNNHGQCSP